MWWRQIWRALFGWKSYAEYLRSRRWASLRSKALKRDGFRCRICNTPYTLQIHHRYYAERWGLETTDALTTLCAWHHEMVEADKEQR